MRETTIIASLTISRSTVLDRSPATPPARAAGPLGVGAPAAFALPNYCVACLGTPDRSLEHEQRERYGLDAIVSSIRVPICSDCAEAARAHRRRGVSLMTHCSLGGIAAALVLGLAYASLAAVWLAAIGPVLGSILLVNATRKATVCAIEDGTPYFVNRHYQRIFERVNGAPSYSAATRAYLDAERDA